MMERKMKRNKVADPVALGQQGGRSERGGGATTEKPVMQVFSCNSSSLGDFFLINNYDIVPPTEPTAVKKEDGPQRMFRNE
jgi:hypothetical protein